MSESCEADIRPLKKNEKQKSDTQKTAWSVKFLEISTTNEHTSCVLLLEKILNASYDINIIKIPNITSSIKQQTNHVWPWTFPQNV